MLGRERSKLPTETSLNCLVISQALLPSFSRLTHAFGKGLPSSWSLLGLGKYLATPWVELGYTLGKAGYTESALWVFHAKNEQPQKSIVEAPEFKRDNIMIVDSIGEV